MRALDAGGKFLSIAARCTKLPREPFPQGRGHHSGETNFIHRHSDNPSKFLVTVDRECRKLFLVDRERTSCETVTELDQRLDRRLQAALTPDARAWNRGLKTIRPIPGGYVLCDIFGVYRLNQDFEIERYLSIPEFTDIHSALPAGETLLVSNTGVDQVLWVDWNGKILDSIDLHRWFPATPWMAEDLEFTRRELGGDLRLMPLDWARESCHVNWAERTSMGTMISCFIQGDILFFNEGKPTLRVPARAKCHAPRFIEATRTILFTASEENKVVEVDLEGRVLWSMDGFQFAKYAELLPNGNLIVADTGNQRIAEIDRRARRVVWECPVPGTPYDVQAMN